MVSDFSFAFLRPAWLLGWLALPFLAWILSRARERSGWERYIAPDKLRHLEIDSARTRQRRQSWVLFALGLAIAALAGPSWRTLPVAVGQSRDAMIIAFDLSPSMLATDINPDRLTRARLKLIDLLRRRTEGETALIAYSGGAHRVAPLTDDTRTIEVLVPSLHPKVMPSRGSEVEAAVALAGELLDGASLERATLVLITDGIAPDAVDRIEEELGSRLDLCLLVVGSEERVPIPLPGGGFLRDSKGQTRLTSTDRSTLERLASESGGCYAELRSDERDLDAIFDFVASRERSVLEDSDRTFDLRQDEGFWIVLALLPLALIAFRKNVLWIAVLGLLVPTLAPRSAQAFEWADLWQRPDQQTEARLREGIERFRQGQFEEAAELFDRDSAISHYNRGNAEAHVGRLEEAIASYEAALEADPENPDAAFNRDLLQKLLEEQQQEQQQENGEGQDEGGDPQDEGQDPGSQNPDSGADSESQSSPENAPPDDSNSTREGDDPAKNERDQNGSPEDENDPADEEDGEAKAANEDLPSQEREASGQPDTSESERTPLSDQSEQWLRNIPEDPGGLLRRKFQYEAELRRRSGQRSAPHERD
jgi:Ca-activated chloride channel family protein